MVEIVEETLVERNTGTENSSQHQRRLYYLRLRHRKRSERIDGLICESLGNLVGHNLADAFEIAAETKHVLLYVYIA